MAVRLVILGKVRKMLYSTYYNMSITAIWNLPPLQSSIRNLPPGATAGAAAAGGAAAGGVAASGGAAVAMFSTTVATNELFEKLGQNM